MKGGDVLRRSGAWCSWIYHYWFTKALVAMGLAGAFITPAWASQNFSFASYPGVYNSEAVSQTLKQSDVITAKPAIYAACEFYNNSAAGAWFMLYNTATVALQTTQTMISFCFAGSAQACSAQAGGPAGPEINAGVPGGNGLTWFASSTFPAQAGIGANALVICTYRN